MLPVRSWTELGMVPVKFAIRVGVVERPSRASNAVIFHSSRPVLLARGKASIRRDERGVGPTLPGVLHVVPYVPDPHVVANARIDVYYQNNDLRLFVVYDYLCAIVGSVKKSRK